MAPSRSSLAALVLLAAGAASAARAAEAPNPLTVGAARFTVVTPECVRLEYDAGRRFVDAPSLFAVGRAARAPYSLSRRGKQVELDTGRLRLVYDDDGKPFSRDNLRAFVRAGSTETVWQPGDWSARDLGGARNLDNTRGPAPMEQGLLSRDGWHLIDDSKRPLLEDGWAVPRSTAAGLDWYFFGYGHDYLGALKALTTIGGPVPLPRRYALGSWYSRWWPHSAADYDRIVREYDEHGFPLDVVVVDMDWHLKNDWTGYTWNRTLFPDPAAFLRRMHAQHLFVTLNDHVAPGVQPFDEAYSRFMAALGAAAAAAAKKTVGYDAGDRRYVDALFSTVLDPLTRLGVDFWWIDYWSEDAAHPLNHLAWVNDLYFRRSERGGLRGLLFSRWPGWGGHRSPIQFSGDTFIDWKTLAFQVPFTANAGNVGAFFWAHDIGGYQGKRDGELLARWTQFGAFSAALRLHSMNKPWLDKRPWSYDKRVEDSMRVALQLRSKLFPYTYTAARQASRDSIPLLRPMYLLYPEREEAYAHPQQYSYGDDFLVAPIVAPGRGGDKRAAQTVWLPEGRWYDWWTGERIPGGETRSFEHPLATFPLFVRGGAPIPMRPYSRRMATDPLTTLVVRAYPGDEGVPGRAELYEDDGVTSAYERGAFATTKLEYLKTGRTARVTIGAAEGSYDGQPAERAYVVELPSEPRALSARVDGAPAAVVYDAVAGVNRVLVPMRDIRRAVVVQLALP